MEGVGEVETVKREKDTEEIDLMIGASIFKAKEDEIKEKIRELIDGLGKEEISLKDVRKIMDRVKGSLSEDIIKERERI